ncbi:uncharacterized protein LY89DRAFT_782950 [Mollisia scopiformis]|uniref:C2H2-type domain-containing protein n=1 Tax=Mollisia scopiformis TaxID=149040 RepID=A0A194X664_MOLSC|nr:uncharacterized protein LY89DRAFT_782950 [Mollisia scopiformis]KUJ15668.1 hypothetical protein LY89DRAFT_782950 [Mollisia scopiformis]
MGMVWHGYGSLVWHGNGMEMAWNNGNGMAWLWGFEYRPDQIAATHDGPNHHVGHDLLGMNGILPNGTNGCRRHHHLYIAATRNTSDDWWNFDPADQIFSQYLEDATLLDPFHEVPPNQETGVQPTNPECKKQMEKKTAMAETSPNQLSCTWPGCHAETFSRPCDLKKHKDEHNKPYLCQESACGISFADKARLRRHTLETHKTAGYKCPFPECSRSQKAFARKYNLTQHIKNRHESSKRQASNLEDLVLQTHTIVGMNDHIPGFEYAQGSTHAMAALKKELQQREAEKKELELVQAHVEAEVERLKKALDILDE